MNIFKRFVKWLKNWVIQFVRKYVLPTVKSTVTLSVSQGPSGTEFNLVIVSTEDGEPDTSDTPVVTVTDPTGEISTLANVGAPDETGTSTTPLTAGLISGAYTYSVSVGGDTQPSATFTRKKAVLPQIHQHLTLIHHAYWPQKPINVISR